MFAFTGSLEIASIAKPLTTAFLPPEIKEDKFNSQFEVSFAINSSGEDNNIVVDKTGPGAEEDDPGQKGDPAGDNRDHDLDDLNQDKDDGAEDLFASQIGAHLGLAGKNPQLVPVDAEANDHDG